MRKEYGKMLRELFARKMKEELRLFKAERIKSGYLFPGERVFRWIPEEPIHCFVMLVPHHTGGDEFTVEIGWSVLGRFPELSARPSVRRLSENRTEFSEKEFVCRLSDTYQKADEWWEFYSPGLDFSLGMREGLIAMTNPIPVEKVNSEVPPKVEDAIFKLKKFGVPFLNEFVLFRRGLQH